MIGTRRRVLAVLLAAVLLVAGAGSTPVGAARAAQQAVTAGHVVAVGESDFYESPTFGYVVDWYRPWGMWHVQTDLSVAGSDELVLDGDPGRMGFDGFMSYGGDATACLADAADRVQRAPSVHRFRRAIFQVAGSGDAARASSLRVAGPARAADVYTFTFTDAGGQATRYALTLDCRTLVRSTAVLLVYYLTTLDRFNDVNLSFQTDHIGVALPRWAFVPDVAGRLVALGELSSDYGSCTVPGRPRRLIDTAGNELGIATDEGYGQQPNSLLVLVENTGTHPLDVADLPFVYRFGDVGKTSSDKIPGQPPRASTAFSLSSARGSGSLLAPGQRALLQLAFAPPPSLGYLLGRLVYVPRAGESVVISEAQLCGGGAGARPRIATGT